MGSGNVVPPHSLSILLYYLVLSVEWRYDPTESDTVVPPQSVSIPSVSIPLLSPFRLWSGGYDCCFLFTVRWAVRCCGVWYRSIFSLTARSIRLYPLVLVLVYASIRL